MAPNTLIIDRQVAGVVDAGGEGVVADHRVVLPAGEGVGDVTDGEGGERDATMRPMPLPRTTSPISTAGR